MNYVDNYSFQTNDSVIWFEDTVSILTYLQPHLLLREIRLVWFPITVFPNVI